MSESCGLLNPKGEKNDNKEKRMIMRNCSICDMPTTLDTAVAEVDHMSAREQWHQWKTWEYEHTAKLPEGHGVDLNEVPYQEPVPWEWNHRNCQRENVTDTYWIAAARINTPEKALGWTLHLNKKTWMDKTNWGDFVRTLGFVNDN